MATDIFDEITEFPDAEKRKRYEELVGIDKEKIHLIKESRVLLNPELLNEWSQKHYKKKIELLSYFKRKPPLFIFSGDVGTGKTSLAESFGDVISREEKIPILLYRLSLQSRGSGTVGEMTKLISGAFSEVKTQAKKAKTGKKPTSAIILLIDEADALAQSREFDQMHHEDKAGVNALIRGIDNISAEGLPVLVIMCTNRLTSIDPAVRRRASFIFDFLRPNDEQREAIITKLLGDTGISSKEITALVKATGVNADRDYGYTYSDIIQRLLPKILLDAFPENPIDYKTAIEAAKKLSATAPFKEK
jgi:AAA+ superfamily predicted ATPase